MVALPTEADGYGTVMDATGSAIDSTPSIAARPQLQVVTHFTVGLDYRPIVGMIVAEAAALEPPPSEQRLADLRVAVTEACSNAVKVHRPEALDEPVIVSGHLDDRGFVVEVRDRGPGFDPGQLEPLPEPTDPERLEHESGLGVELIRELADDVSFRAVEGGTVVSMVLDLHRPVP